MEVDINRSYACVNMWNSVSCCRRRACTVCSTKPALVGSWKIIKMDTCTGAKIECVGPFWNILSDLDISALYCVWNRSDSLMEKTQTKQMYDDSMMCQHSLLSFQIEDINKRVEHIHLITCTSSLLLFSSDGLFEITTDCRCQTCITWGLLFAHTVETKVLC